MYVYLRNSLYCSLCILTLSQAALGHGFTLGLSGSSLVANSENPASDLNPLIFVEDFSTVAGVIQADHGFAGGGTVFATGKHFSFDIRGPLWYSNGGPAEPAPLGVKLTLLDQQAGFTGQSLSLFGTNTGITAGFPVSGKSSHEMIWTITLDTTVPGHVASIPDGMYGIAFSIAGGATGGANYAPTPWLVTAMATPNFDSDPLNPNPGIDAGARAIYAAAVPEPATWLTALLGVACVGLLRRRWRR